MPPTETLQAHTRLNAYEELFAEPGADPFDPASRYQSGIDEIAAQLRWQRLTHPARITITLPAESFEPGLEAKLKAALDRYCAYQIEANQRELDGLHHDGRGSLGIGVVVLTIILIIGGILFTTEILPPAIEYFVGSFLGIMSWVALWNPADIYLSQWRPYSREIRLHTCIQRAELVLDKAA
jgi:hypothetical protein